jgi:hypothetical protein
MSNQKDTAEALEREAAEIITRDILKLSAGVQSGTAARLVRCLVDASVARVIENLEQQRAARQEAASKMAAPALRPMLKVPK